MVGAALWREAQPHPAGYGGESSASQLQVHQFEGGRNQQDELRYQLVQVHCDTSGKEVSQHSGGKNFELSKQ